eukprot:gene14838-19944_t
MSTEAGPVKKRAKHLGNNDTNYSNSISEAEISNKKSCINPYLKQVNKLKKTIPEWESNSFFIDESKDGKSCRIMNWIRLEVLGEPCCRKYAWAIPDERSLNILAQFSPLVEIGAGKGYWAKLLRERNVDILPFDKILYDDNDRWVTVIKGGPAGEYIIHIGELLQTGTLSGYPQAPFGRTTSSDFCVSLAENFHCLLIAEIPRFPFSKDCISVWKRTKWVEGRNENEFNDDNNSSDLDAEINVKSCWAAIPKSEILPSNIAAPILEHLL